MDPITTFSGKAVALPLENVDTDQIIPARYLKVTDKSGLGEGLFSAWRYMPDGAPNPDFVLNRPDSAGAQVLIAGRNFGCGSRANTHPGRCSTTAFGPLFRPISPISFAITR